MLNTDLLQRFADKQPYPSREDDTADSEILRLVNGEHLFDTRTLNYPYRFNHGDIYYSVYRGGGGLGDPLERDPGLIENDLNGNFILPRYAEKVFGAVASREPGGLWKVDGSKTEDKRAELKNERSKRAMPVAEFLSLERERVMAGRLAPEVRIMYNQSMDLSARWGKGFREFWNLPDDFHFSEAESVE